MTKFDELADMPTHEREVEPPQEDGRRPTIYEETEADLEAHIMEMRRTELHDKKELLDATPVEELCAAPARMISDKIAGHSS
eukprot:2638935-Pyramimonas_sp.AAC.1